MNREIQAARKYVSEIAAATKCKDLAEFSQLAKEELVHINALRAKAGAWATKDDEVTHGKAVKREAQRV